MGRLCQVVGKNSLKIPVPFRSAPRTKASKAAANLLRAFLPFCVPGPHPLPTFSGLDLPEIKLFFNIYFEIIFNLQNVTKIVQLTYTLYSSYPNVSVQFSLVSQSCPTLCDCRTAARQASLSITNSRNLLKLMSIKSVMPSNHLILCHPVFLLPSIFPSIRVFSNESALCIRWPKYWSFSFSLSPSNEYLGLISFRMD